MAASTGTRVAVQTGATVAGAAIGSAFGPAGSYAGAYVGAAIGSAVGSMVNAIWGGSDEEEAREAAARLREAEAQELLERQKINEEIMKEDAFYRGAELVGAAGSTGRGGASLGVKLKVQNQLAKNIAITRRDAEWKASQLRAGAAVERQLGSDAMTSAYVSGASTLINTGLNVYASRNLFSKGSPQGLGNETKSEFAAYKADTNRNVLINYSRPAQY